MKILIQLFFFIWSLFISDFTGLSGRKDPRLWRRLSQSQKKYSLEDQRGLLWLFHLRICRKSKTAVKVLRITASLLVRMPKNNNSHYHSILKKTSQTNNAGWEPSIPLPSAPPPSTWLALLSPSLLSPGATLPHPLFPLTSLILHFPLPLFSLHELGKGYKSEF